MIASINGAPGQAARRVFVRAAEIGVFSAQRACGAAKLIGGRVTLNW
jgi:hypothetical protein